MPVRARLTLPGGLSGGDLFETDPTTSSAGAEHSVCRNTVFEPALRALLLDEAVGLRSPGGRSVDFRSLRVREFGTIYEGLLEPER
jgi:hypothetical protein